MKVLRTQALNHWFSGNGKTLIVKVATDIHLYWMMPYKYMDTTYDAEYMQRRDDPPAMHSAPELTAISSSDKIAIITDIPEGAIFYATTSGDGTPGTTGEIDIAFQD